MKSWGHYMNRSTQLLLEHILTWLRFGYSSGEPITQEGDGKIHCSFRVTCRNKNVGTSQDILSLISEVYWHCNLTTEEVQTAVLLLSHLSTNQSSAPTVLTSLPCLKNSSMICSLHILLRCRHREGLLMSAALIAICENCKIYNSGLKDVRNHLS